MPNKKYISIVKRRLWASGFRVEERSREIDGFDLLVEGKYKLAIIGKGRRLIPEGCLTSTHLAQVTFDAAKRAVVVYMSNTSPENGPSPKVVFGLLTKKEKHGKKQNSKT